MDATAAEQRDAPVAHLHPFRGPGVAYAVLAGLVLVAVLGGFGTNLARGRLLTALAVLLAGSLVAGFVALLAVAVLGPSLVLTPDGVRGRVSVRRRVDLRWSEVTVDVPPDPAPGRLLLVLGPDSFEVQERSWAGVDDAVLVLTRTPAALARLTPAAVDELLRLLSTGGRRVVRDPHEGPGA